MNGCSKKRRIISSTWLQVICCFGLFVFSSASAAPGEIRVLGKNAHQFVALPFLDSFGLQAVCHLSNTKNQGLPGIIKNEKFIPLKKITKRYSDSPAFKKAARQVTKGCRGKKQSKGTSGTLYFVLADAKGKKQNVPLIEGTTLYLTELPEGKANVLALSRTGRKPALRAEVQAARARTGASRLLIISDGKKEETLEPGTASFCAPGAHTKKECIAVSIKPQRVGGLILTEESEMALEQGRALGKADFQESNIASLARVTASSSDVANGSLPEGAVDGVIAGFPDPQARRNEWATDPGGSAPKTVGAWITLSWNSPVSLKRIVFHDRVNREDQLLGGVLFFDDNSSQFISIRDLPNGGYSRTYHFSGQTIRSLTYRVTSVSSSTKHAGLSEIEVFGSASGGPGTNTPVSPTRTPVPTVRPDQPTPTPRPTVGPSISTPTPTGGTGGNLASSAWITASSQDTDNGSLASGVIDGRVDGYPNAAARSAEWSALRSSAQPGAGAWVELTWPSTVTIERVVLHDRINEADQVVAGRLWFDGVSSSTVAVGALPNDGRALEVRVPSRAARKLRFEVTSVSPSTWATGLAEIAVYGSSSVVTTPTPTPGSFSMPEPPIPPGQYVLPSSAVRVRSTAELLQALASREPQNIILADGRYDSDRAFGVSVPHRLYAENVGKAVLTVGLGIGGNNWSGEPAIIQGLTFSVDSPAKTYDGHNQLINIWANANNVKLLDLTLDGRDRLQYGIYAHNPEGLEIRRVVAHHFHYAGIRVDKNNQVHPPRPLGAKRPILEDLNVSYVSAPVPFSEGGRAEACIWLGHEAVAKRWHVHHCSWMGLWVGGETINLQLSDVRVDDVPNSTAVYLEHHVVNSTLRRIYVGPRSEIGLICEWADSDWGGTPGCDGVAIEDSVFESACVGILLDGGTRNTTVRRSVFRGQRWTAINNHKEASDAPNLRDAVGNNTSGIRSGAVPVSTEHYGANCPLHQQVPGWRW